MVMLARLYELGWPFKVLKTCDFLMLYDFSYSIHDFPVNKVRSWLLSFYFWGLSFLRCCSNGQRCLEQAWCMLQGCKCQLGRRLHVLYIHAKFHQVNLCQSMEITAVAWLYSITLAVYTFGKWEYFDFCEGVLCMELEIDYWVNCKADLRIFSFFYFAG